MKAIVFHSKEKGPMITTVPAPLPGKGEVLVQLRYAALNHLDLWIWHEQVLKSQVISGSDGSGMVKEVGQGVDVSLIGQEVIINPSLYWGENELIPDPCFEILGEPTNGTFAEYVVVPQEYIYEKPAHLTLKEAAALPLAALTAYRALFTKARATSRDKVLITGIGGGAALFLLQMATAHGAQVYVTSSSEEKIKRAIELGAANGYTYKDWQWVEKAKQDVCGFDVVIDSAGGSGFAALTEVAAPGARIVLFGRTAGDSISLKPSVIYNKQLQIMGSVMGTQKEFASTMAFYRKHRLVPVIDKEFHFDEFYLAKQYLERENHFGKIILNLA